MKRLLMVLLAFSTVARADMAGIGVGVAQGSSPFFVADYEFVKDITYLDVSLSINKDFVQPGVSVGFQFEHINIGIGVSLANRVISLGPEFGYMQNLSDLVYIKVNSNLMGFPGSKFNLGATLGLGLNL